MTPYHHHIDGSYLEAYTAELSQDLRNARATAGGFRRTRRYVGSLIVRMGARLLPETPDIVDGRIIVFDVPDPDRTLHRAA